MERTASQDNIVVTSNMIATAEKRERVEIETVATIQSSCYDESIRNNAKKTKVSKYVTMGGSGRPLEDDDDMDDEEEDEEYWEV